MKTSIECYNELIQAIHDHATLDAICRLYACYILACWSSNVTQAARILKISCKSLQTKMKEFGLRDQQT